MRSAPDARGAAGQGSAARERVRAALALARDRLDAAGLASPAAEARTIVEDAAGAPGSLVLVHDLPDGFEARIDEVLARRAQHEPLQIILGWAPFRRLRLATAPGVFVPRPETELMIDLLRTLAPRARRIADLCTGSGAIAAAVLDETPLSEVVALEREERALRLAACNLARIAPPERWALLRGDVRTRGWEHAAGAADHEALISTGALDAVLANPPYIPPDAVPRDAEVREHDPEGALYGGGPDGLDAPRAVLDRAQELLAPGGLLVLEHADVQGAALRRIAEDSGAFTATRTERDLTGRDRFLLARRA